MTPRERRLAEATQAVAAILAPVVARLRAKGGADSVSVLAAVEGMASDEMHAAIEDAIAIATKGTRLYGQQFDGERTGTVYLSPPWGG